MSQIFRELKNPNFSGGIELIIGPMFSGKTSEMIKRLNKYLIGPNAKNVIIFKLKGDLRGNENQGDLISHNGVKIKCHRIKKLDNKIFEFASGYDVIGIDEGHFFELNEEEEKEEKEKNLGLFKFCMEFVRPPFYKKLIVSAINMDYKREPFKEVNKLLHFSEKVTKLNSVCLGCSSHKAIFTFKKENQNKRIDIGGKEKYFPLCRNCYELEIKK